MAGITGQGLTYNLPNYVGELFSASPEDTPLLSAIGGLTGGVSTGGSKMFEWQFYDLRDAASNRQRVEGADAPTAEARVRSSAFNVVEIHQEAVDISYTKQATTGVRSGTAAGGASMPEVNVGGTAIPANELAWQLDQTFKQIARDVELTFITGTFQNPTSNATPRKTRGLLQAITTNTVAAPESPTAVATDPTGLDGLTADSVLDLFQRAWENGGIREAETRTLVVNAAIKRRLTKLFVTEKGYEESTRNVGGVNLQTIETDFGRANIMLNRYMPADKLAVVSLEDLAPRFLEIPGKGHFFAEPLAKTGASDKVQVYGEIGLEYGNEAKHGVLTLTPQA